MGAWEKLRSSAPDPAFQRPFVPVFLAGQGDLHILRL